MDIGKWLRGLGLAQYEPAFRKHDIDFEVLPKLTAEDLRDLGVESVGRRRKLLAAIAELTARPVPSAPQPAPPADAQGAERRHLTVLVCDLVGSTALTTKLDPEDMRRVIAIFNRCCADAIESHGGFVAKYLGDGALAYFGYPEAHENDPELAVEAGLAVVDGVQKLKTAAHEALRVRVGIATGLVVVGDIIGSGAAEERGVVGETPNLAARLQTIAEPDSVVISDDTRRLLGSLFELRDLGISQLKGISAPSRAWMVLARSAVESRFEALRGSKLTAFVGREREVELLLRLWERAKAGEGQVALVHGEAGVGKSRLVAEFLKAIADEPQMRLRYYCSSQHLNTALYPVIVQMQRLAGFAGDDPPKVMLDKLDAMFAATHTSREDAALLADLLSLENDGRYPSLDISQPERRRRRVMNALIGQIEAVARNGPALMILEDAHWADPTTVEMLGRVVERIATLRVLHLVVYRPEIEAPWLNQNHVTEVAVARLAPPVIGAMIDDVARGQGLPPDARNEIVRRADGVPLFAEELTKAVIEAERDGGAAPARSPGKVAVPASLQDSLMARLDRLGPAKEAAQIAAAIGRQSPFGLLAAVAHTPPGELEAALERLVEAGLMFREGTPPKATYLFKHALLQDIAYGALLRERKQALHARIAEALEAQFPEVGETQPETLARHCAEAGLVEKAAALWGKAGRRSLKRSALVEAESHFSQALAQIAAHPSTPLLRREEIASQIGLASTLQLRRGFASPEAKAALSRTLELIERAGSLGEPVEDPLALFTTLHGFWVASVVASAGKGTQRLAAQCLSLAERAGAKGELIAGLRAVGLSQLFAGDLLASRASLDKAIALFSPAQDHAATRYGADHWSSALSGRGAALWALGYPDAALADAALALKSAREFGHAFTLGNNLIFAAWTCFGCGRYAVAGDHADELVALADAKGEPFYNAFGLMLQGLVLTAAGDAETAIKLLTSALSAYQASGATLLTPHLLAYLAKAYARLQRWDDARGRLDDAAKIIEGTGERWCESDTLRIAGEIALAKPDKDEAKAEGDFKRALTLARRQRAKSWELRAATSMARLWAEQGKRREARELIAPVYGWFTEGFDTLDLREAKTALEALAPA